jgi:hypothetical protein
MVLKQYSQPKKSEKAHYICYSGSKNSKTGDKDNWISNSQKISETGD